MKMIVTLSRIRDYGDWSLFCKKIGIDPSLNSKQGLSDDDQFLLEMEEAQELFGLLD